MRASVVPSACVLLCVGKLWHRFFFVEKRLHHRGKKVDGKLRIRTDEFHMFLVGEQSWPVLLLFLRLSSFADSCSECNAYSPQVIPEQVDCSISSSFISTTSATAAAC